MTTTTVSSAVTSTASFSWYVPPSHKLLQKGAELADAITVAGPKGPSEIRKRRDSGFVAPVLFDGTGYKGTELPSPAAWVAAQRDAGADRALLPGVFVPWEKDDDGVLVDAVRREATVARDLDATLVLALDARWVAKRYQLLVDLFADASQPVAIVLAHRADPLSIGDAVIGLRWLSSRTRHLSVLRSDHGSIGAVAFGARHASIGLSTTNRHFATAKMRPRRLQGGSARVFDRRLLDWFRAGEMAGWSATGADIRCYLRCCNGQPLGRFLDTDLDATWHNMIALADFADQILDADPLDRSVEFLNECRAAAGRYGLAGFKGPENPKPQLTGWVLS